MTTLTLNNIKEYMLNDEYKGLSLIGKQMVINYRRRNFEPFFEYEIAYEKLKNSQRRALTALENHNWAMKKT